MMEFVGGEGMLTDPIELPKTCRRRRLVLLRHEVTGQNVPRTLSGIVNGSIVNQLLDIHLVNDTPNENYMYIQCSSFQNELRKWAPSQDKCKMRSSDQ
eukprot:2115426-Amphidinium_carterae.1